MQSLTKLIFVVSSRLYNGHLRDGHHAYPTSQMLGVPFNIASYSLLTHMLCHLTGLKPGEFVHTLGDAHVYQNHLEGLNIQVSGLFRFLPFVCFKFSNLEFATRLLISIFSLSPSIFRLSLFMNAFVHAASWPRFIYHEFVINHAPVRASVRVCAYPWVHPWVHPCACHERTVH